MKIRIDKDVVTFTPEHAAETAELEALWIKLGNCLGATKSLQPIGTLYLLRARLRFSTLKA